MTSPLRHWDGLPRLSERQERIASRLSQVGSGPARFFRDACELMAEQPPRVTATHLVTHLLREVESALRAVIEPLYAAGVSEHAAKILAVLGGLEIDRADHPIEIGLLGVHGGPRSRQFWSAPSSPTSRGGHDRSRWAR